MTINVLPPKVAEFMRGHWESASHRRMFFIGQVAVKVSGMFQLTLDEPVPEEATGAFILLLEGLEAGDAEEYSRCDAMAMALYREWLASREVH